MPRFLGNIKSWEPQVFAHTIQTNYWSWGLFRFLTTTTKNQPRNEPFVPHTNTPKQNKQKKKTEIKLHNRKRRVGGGERRWGAIETIDLSFTVAIPEKCEKRQHPKRSSTKWALEQWCYLQLNWLGLFRQKNFALALNTDWLQIFFTFFFAVRGLYTFFFTPIGLHFFCSLWQQEKKQPLLTRIRYTQQENISLFSFLNLGGWGKQNWTINTRKQKRSNRIGREIREQPGAFASLQNEVYDN